MSDRHDSDNAPPGGGARRLPWLFGALAAVLVVALLIARARDGEAPTQAGSEAPAGAGSPEARRGEDARSLQPADVNASTPPWSRPGLASRGVSGDGTLPSQLPAFRVGQRQIDDPTRDGWRSEVWSQRVDAQLAVLATWLAQPGATDGLERLVSEDFVATPLVPARRDTVLVRTGLVVRRGDPARLREAPAARKGREGLVEALRELRSAMNAGDAPLRLKLKTVGIEPVASGVRTRHLFTAVLEAAHELHATWECTWLGDDDDAPPRLRALHVTAFEEITSERGKTLFADCTQSVFGDPRVFRDQLAPGIHRWLRSIDISVDPDFEGMQGLAVGDVDGDDLEDVYICQGGGLPNRLFVQRADGTLRDASSPSGVDWIETTRSALLVDLDNDDDSDLVLALDGAVVVMDNDGTGRFGERARFESVGLAFSLSAADYDVDGDLDLYACRYFAESEKSVGQLPNPVPYHDANNGGRNVLLRNEGGFAFTDATRESGLEANNRRWSYAAAWEDYDNDGDVDLYVANDFGRNNLYRNDGGRFEDVAAAAGVEDIASGMSVTWGDFDADGWMDLYVSNMFSSAGNRITFRRSFQPQASEATRGWYQRLARGNTLFQNAGDGTFRDVSEEASVTMGRWSWGSLFADINNDGLEDIVVANGYVTGDNTGDL